MGGGGGGGGKGGPNSQQAHDVVMTSMRRNDVASMSFRRHVPNRFLINQCQIITFLILKYDIIENSRTELRGIVLPVQVDALLGRGGGKGYVGPPSQIIGGACPPPPPPPPLAPLFLRLWFYQLNLLSHGLVPLGKWVHFQGKQLCHFQCYFPYKLE